MDPKDLPAPAPLLRGLLTRRSLMQGMGAIAAGAALSACGTKARAPQANTGAPSSAGGAASSAAASSAAASSQAAQDLSDTEKVVNWSNWPEYIDVNNKNQSHPTLDAFTKQTGIKVNYTEDYNDNDEFFAKVRPQLSSGQDTGRDVWCSTDWMVARLIRLGWVQKLDKANIPNSANLQDSLVNVEFDTGRNYSLPWQSGFTGIAYNPKATGGMKVETIDQLLTDKRLRNKVTLLTEMRDTVGMVLLALGKDPANFSDADFDAAIAEIQKAKDAGQLRGFTGNEYGKALASGDTAACLAWTGDVVQLRADNPSLGYVLPATGFMLWSDNFVIPNKARHKKNAETLINYYYDPKVMAQVEDYVNYISPVKGAQAILKATDPSVADNQLIFPTQQTLSHSHVFKGLTEAQETAYNRKFQALVGG